ncbi:MAG: helix-turn-helix domain-containing protein [Pseudomonadales bacterium]|jgi:DNA-binding HxlR family transcriptional regulator|nr:helix-turn-helix domain-containing protein [Pseudomonadales bacterium]
MEFRSSCPIAQSLDVIGDRWTLLIMRDALLFQRRTFAEFASSPEHIPTNLLADRLKKLVKLGLLEKIPYQDKPLRYEYIPTDAGQKIKPLLRALRDYGQQLG